LEVLASGGVQFLIVFATDGIWILIVFAMVGWCCVVWCFF
jgi:hypothetical protein